MQNDDRGLTEFEEKVFNILRLHINEKLLYDFTPETDFLSLGINSMTFIKMIVDLEETYNIEFEDEMLAFEAFPNAKALINYVELVMNSRCKDI